MSPRKSLHTHLLHFIVCRKQANFIERAIRGSPHGSNTVSNSPLNNSVVLHFSTNLQLYKARKRRENDITNSSFPTKANSPIEYF
jgi:hypothetical protein